MSINHQEIHKRYRVYIARGSKKPPIQEYFGYGQQGKYSSQKKAEVEATKRHEVLREKHLVIDRSTPFFYPKGHRNHLGIDRNSPLEIRNIYLTLSTCRLGSSPDWSITPRYKSFHTYPPTFVIGKFEYDDGVRKYLNGHRVKIRSSRSYKLACVETVDAYIAIYPEYADFRDQLIERMPSWKLAWSFIWNKAKERHDCFE